VCVCVCVCVCARVCVCVCVGAYASSVVMSAMDSGVTVAESADIIPSGHMYMVG
jgi:hypothetical protein